MAYDIQSASNYRTSSASNAVTFPSATTGGNTLIVGYVANFSATGAPSFSQTLTQARHVNDATNSYNFGIYYNTSAASVSSVTVTFSQSCNSTCWAMEFDSQYAATFLNSAQTVNTTPVFGGTAVYALSSTLSSNLPDDMRLSFAVQYGAATLTPRDLQNLTYPPGIFHFTISNTDMSIYVASKQSTTTQASWNFWANTNNSTDKFGSAGTSWHAAAAPPGGQEILTLRSQGY